MRHRRAANACTHDVSIDEGGEFGDPVHADDPFPNRVSWASTRH
ncbi:hypothetical protein SUS17_4 [Sphingomonas sp. S17]|nr:hypothetical protein SUS17_4 [Sphingomonas sp. S17]